MNLKGLSYNQKRILKLMRDRKWVIRSVYDNIRQEHQNNLEDEEGENHFEKVATILMNRLVAREIFEAETITPSLYISVTTFRAKRELKKYLR